MNIIQRAKAPTPKFFRILRNIGIVLAAASATLFAAPIALPKPRLHYVFAQVSNRISQPSGVILFKPSWIAIDN